MNYAQVNAINWVYDTLVAAAAAPSGRLYLAGLKAKAIFLGRSAIVLDGTGPWAIIYYDQAPEEPIGANVVKTSEPKITITVACNAQSETYPYGRVTKVNGSQVVAHGIMTVAYAILQSIEEATAAISLGTDPVSGGANVQDWTATVENIGQTGENLYAADIKIAARIVFAASGR